MELAQLELAVLEPRSSAGLANLLELEIHRFVLILVW